MKKILLVLLLFVSSQVVGQKVYITNTGEKYHRSDCRYLKKSKIETSLQEAIVSGYTACKVCAPPTQVKESSQKEEAATPTPKPDHSAVSSQCSATTQKGARCKRMTKSPNGKCFQHGGVRKK